MSDHLLAHTQHYFRFYLAWRLSVLLGLAPWLPVAAASGAATNRTAKPATGTAHGATGTVARYRPGA
ncbi:hypothetical protein [Hymenobacter canadensis]|uniref:Uncharacterized protein n=1 Tax=Hymenobacter canadensis TaxID=2999067 RepID=A0ABY7LU65_9BACT|nr:hypothetical protein [Hymenobacter canadensis]WBA43953.1 hypothetical protein O3303_20515 [Hymenobacter canadensis]